MKKKSFIKFLPGGGGGSAGGDFTAGGRRVAFGHVGGVDVDVVNRLLDHDLSFDLESKFSNFFSSSTTLRTK
jgi:hypothetical protein